MHRNSRRFGGIVVLALCSLLALNTHPTIGGEANPAADPSRPAEFKPLDRWLGTWDLEITVKPGPVAKDGAKSTFVSTVTWDLNGRFLRCAAKGQTVAGDGQKVDDSFLWMCTYEPQRMEYRSWVFWSAAGGSWGATPPGSAKWDEATKTMTITSEEGGTTSHGTTRWIDDDNHEFHTVYKDAAGQVIMDQAGKAKRRK